MIYNPETATDAEPYWEYEEPTINDVHDVPADHEIKVIDAWVMLTK
jgi:hypothetical protein